MNVLASNARSLLNIVNNGLLKKVPVLPNSAGFKTELTIKWVRPEKIPSMMPAKSGDGGITLDLKPQDYIRYYDQSKELEDANDLVKKIFSLEFRPQRETRDKKRELIVQMVQRHPSDFGSMESTIAILTAEILHLQEHMYRHPWERRGKMLLKELIDKRKKYLGKLRRWDYKRFEWLLEKLNLIYKPNPALHLKVMRKKSLVKLTHLHCLQMKVERLKEYQKELESQQVTFFTDKLEKMQFMRQEEISCGREPTITEEDIENAKKQVEKYAALRGGIMTEKAS